MKKCSRCQLDKNLTDFYKQKQGRDGLRPDCKSCYKSLITNWQKKTGYIQRYDSSKREYFRVYMNNRRKNDIKFKIAGNLRNRLNLAIKHGSAIDFLGCSIEEFQKYIENKFQPGMTWANHGDWHLDHIRPLNSFDLLNTSELMIACHFSNFQPLWAAENIRKSDKYILSEKNS